MNVIELSTLRILRSDGKTVGTGFLVSHNLAVTCAHVVVTANAIDGDTIQVQFTDQDEKINALVEPLFWRDVDKGDIAFLRLETVPVGIQPLPLAPAHDSRAGSEFRSFGYATAADVQGIHANGKIDGYLPQHKLLQLQSSQANHGISGGPVFDEVRDVVVGVITKGHTELGRNQETTFATPTELLFEICPEIRSSETCPYLGLETFTAETARFFFGRETLTQKLATILRGGCRFLAVFGPSGSGKSSLVRAGLLPRIADGLFSEWTQIVMRPTDQPFEQLKAAGLDSLRTIPDRTILFIDQFEELLTLCPDALRHEFVEKLAEALNNSRFLLVISMRDDFYSTFNANAASLATSEHLRIENVPGTLRREELLAMMERPAALAGLALEEGLAELILKDLTRDGEARSSTLPLLEFTLAQLWRMRKDGFLTHEAYQAIDGVTGSLARWADEAYNDLPQTERLLAESLLTSLVHLGDEAQGLPDTRKRRSLNDFDEQIMRIIRHFADRRLLATGQETVELVHDALVREWGRLQGWLKNNRVQLRLLEDVSESTKAWSVDPKNPDLLDHRGGRLEDALKLQHLTVQERSYLAACRTAEQRRRNIALISLSMVAVILAILGGFGWYQARVANQEAQKASQQKLSALALANIVNERTDLAMLTSVETYHRSLNSDWLLASSSQRALLTTLQETNRINRFIWSSKANKISALVFINDQKIAYGNDQGQVVVLEPDQDGKQKTFEYHGTIKSLALSPDGHTLAVAHCLMTTPETLEPCQGEVKLVDLSSGENISIPTQQNDALSSGLIFSPDGKTLAFGSRELLMLWDLEKQELQNYVVADGVIRSLAFHPNGKLLAMGLPNSKIQLFHLDTGKEDDKELKSSSTTFALAFHPSGSILAAGTSNNQVILWDTETWEQLTVIKGHQNPVLDIVFSNDGKLMASTSVGTIRLFTLEQSNVREKDVLTGYRYVTSDIAFSPNGKLLASATKQSVLLWNTDVIPIFKILSVDKRVVYSPGANQNQDIRLLAFSENDTVLVSLSNLSEITYHYLDSQSSRVQNLDRARNAPPLSAISADATLLAYTYPREENNNNCNITLFSPAENETVSDFTCQGNPNSLAISPDGKFLALGTRDGQVSVWDTLSNNLIFTQTSHQGMVHSLAFSPQAKLLASSGCAQGEVVNCTSEEIRLWDIRKGQEIARFLGHAGLVRALVFNPTGTMLASGSYDGNIILWDVEKKRQVGTPLVGHASYVNILAFSPDGNILASGSSDLHIILWDVQLQERIGGPLVGHASAIRALAFNHTGSQLVSGDNLGNIFQWDISPDSLAKDLCAKIGRNFTRAEWVQYFPDAPYRATCQQWPLEPEQTTAP